MNAIYFYTQDCEICKEIEPELDIVEKDLGIEFLRIDVEEGEDERTIFDELALDECGGVPFIYNQENKKFICGFATANKIKEIID